MSFGRDTLAGNIIERLEQITARLAAVELLLASAGESAGNLAYFRGEDGSLNAPGVGNFSAGGIRVRVVDDNVSNPPTDAELDTAFGSPATMGEGFVGIVDDNDAATNVWLIGIAGGAWWYEALTKAV